MSYIGSSTTYVKERGETTECNDVLVKKGIIYEAADIIEYREEKALEAALAEEAMFSIVDPLEDKKLGELDRLANEDDKYADDVDALREYRTQRLLELEERSKLKTYASDVRQIQKSDFVREVTEASKSSWIVLHLYKDSHTACVLMSRALSQLSPKFPRVRFLKIVSTECVENFPDSELPCLIIYHDGELQHQTAGLGQFGGLQITAESLEWSLSNMGVLQTEMTGNPLTELDSPGRRMKLQRNFVAKRSHNVKRSGHVKCLRKQFDESSDSDDY